MRLGVAAPIVKVQKDDEPPKKPPQAEIEAYLNELMAAIGWDSLPGAVAPQITAASLGRRAHWHPAI